MVRRLQHPDKTWTKPLAPGVTLQEVGPARSARQKAPDQLEAGPRPTVEPAPGSDTGSRGTGGAQQVGVRALGFSPAAPMTPAAANRLFDHLHLSMGSLSGQAAPGLFDTVRISRPYQADVVSEVGADGRFFTQASMGAKRPITVTFSGPGGELTIQSNSSNVSPGAATTFEGLNIRDYDGKSQRPEDLRGALRFRAEPASYSFRAPAPAEISPQAAAEHFEHANFSNGGLSGRTVPGAFSKVTFDVGYSKSSAEVSSDGQFWVRGSVGIDRPVTITFEGPAGTLVIDTKGPKTPPGATTGVTGIPIRDSFGKVSLPEDLPGALRFSAQAATYRFAAPTLPGA